MLGVHTEGRWTMHFTRVYADAAGESHFEDVTVEGELRRSPVSASLSQYSDPYAARSVVFRRVVTPHPDEPHIAPRRQFAVHLSGHAQVEVSDGERREFGPGEVVLLEDTQGVGHITREVGEEERVTLFIELDGGEA
jgi:hypothetical protein